MNKVLTLAAIVLVVSSVTAAQTGAADDNSAITQTALNYIEGWYEGDAARMESSLHSELAKRMIYTDPKTGRSQFNHMGAMALVQGTRRGGGRQTPKEKQLKEITILDRYQNAAIVRVNASDWVDYLSVAKVNGEWKIINVLWELRPKPTEPTTSNAAKP